MRRYQASVAHAIPTVVGELRDMIVGPTLKYEWKPMAVKHKLSLSALENCQAATTLKTCDISTFFGSLDEVL